MKVVVGSTNPVKVAAVTEALKERFKQLVVEGVGVETGVDDQPLSDEATKRGAEERAKKAFEQRENFDLSVGIEGGVFRKGGELWNTVWCVAVDKRKRKVAVNGERFMLPERLAEAILAGEEMGPAMDKLTGRKNIKHQEGMLGIVTDGLLPRMEAYAHLVKLAVGQLLAKEWF